MSWKLFKKEVILDENNEPYIKRWRVIDTPWFGVFVHNILASDTDRDLHDHPWNFVSILLKGVYDEENEAPGEATRRTSPCMIIHKSTDLHRISIIRPTWTLFIHGRKSRPWGFKTSNGWIKNTEYNDNKHKQGS